MYTELGRKKFIKKLSILMAAGVMASAMPYLRVSAKISNSITSIIANAEVENFGETVKNFEITVNNIDLSTIDKDDFVIDNAVIDHLGTEGDIKVNDVTIEDNKITLEVDDFLTIKSNGSLLPEELKVTCTENDELSFSYSDITKIVSKTADKFETKLYNGLNYKLFSPKKSEKLPLVIWMHGRGDNGIQLRSAKNAVMFAEDEVQSKNPTYVMAPQSDESVTAIRWTDNELDNIATVVRDLIDSGKVDKNRVYIVGHSMGGQGTWNLLRKNPDLFAAAITMAPRIIAEEAELTDLEKLKELPVWMFHAESDPVNKVSGSRDRYKRLLEVGNTKVKYTELNDDEMKGFGLGYLSPDEYHATNIVMANTPGVVDWLFAQHKAEVSVNPDTGKDEEKDEEVKEPSVNVPVDTDKENKINDNTNKETTVSKSDSAPKTGDTLPKLLALGAVASLGVIGGLKKFNKKK